MTKIQPSMRAQNNPQKNPLAADLDYILLHTKDLWENLRGKRICITGGTGFFGCWLLESFTWANAKLNLDAEAMVITRDKDSFQRRIPHLATHPAIRLHPGDIRNFDAPAGEFSYVIHAAATTSVATFKNQDLPLEKFDTIVAGTRHILDFAVRCRAKKFLFTSSGAVYGKPPPGGGPMAEDYQGALDFAHPSAVVGLCKRTAEFLCALYANQYGLETKIARCFTFIGPYLPLDIHYAIGNFIADRMKKRPIVITGDGSAYRSYLYAADLMIWLWTILFRGKTCRPYNVGSEEAMNMCTLATMVAQTVQPALEVQMNQKKNPNAPADCYVPSTFRARTELHLQQHVSLPEAIQRTIAWHNQDRIANHT